MQNFVWRCAYKFCKKHCFHMLTIANIMLVQNFEIPLEKFNIFGICNSGNYLGKWISKLYAY